MSVHPWNRDLWRQLSGMRGRLPHALLLHGVAGVGKRELALALARWLLCQNPLPEGACGQCPSCVWLAQGGHPDLRIVEPRQEEGEGGKGKRGGRLITVEDVRAVVDFLSLSAHQCGWRVVLIEPAEAMNTAAANALLKTLEEPPPGVLLILVSHRPRRLLPTVLSRCRRMSVPLPERETALEWLAEQGLGGNAVGLLRESGGAPLLALEYADQERIAQRDQFTDALCSPGAQDWPALAQAMQTRLADAWGWLLRWVCDLLACRAGVGARYFPQYGETLRQISTQADPVRLWGLYRQLAADGRSLNHPLNAPLLLESWLLRYASLEADR